MSGKHHSFEPTHVFANLSPRILTSHEEEQFANQKRRVEVRYSAMQFGVYNVLQKQYLLIEPFLKCLVLKAVPVATEPPGACGSSY